MISNSKKLYHSIVVFRIKTIIFNLGKMQQNKKKIVETSKNHINKKKSFKKRFFVLKIHFKMEKPPNFKKEMCRVCFSSDSSLESLYSMINFETLTQLKSFIEIEEVERLFFIIFFLSN